MLDSSRLATAALSAVVNPENWDEKVVESAGNRVPGAFWEPNSASVGLPAFRAYPAPSSGLLPI